MNRDLAERHLHEALAALDKAIVFLAPTQGKPAAEVARAAVWATLDVVHALATPPGAPA